MSVPKVIYYCWFGKEKMPALAKKCIKSWKKYCPDYKIVCINEENFDVSQNKYAKQAYDMGKWAFVSDYARLKVLYDEGGIYFDTDVELLKPIDKLLEGAGYMGFDDMGLISTGIGFACEKENPVIGAVLADYDDISFILPDGSLDLMPCPERNTKVLVDLGMDINDKDQVFKGIRILPEDYLCPMKYYSGKKIMTENTHSIHHFSASWISATAKRTLIAKRILGVKLYNKLYGKFLHRCKWLEW